MKKVVALAALAAASSAFAAGTVTNGTATYNNGLNNVWGSQTNGNGSFVTGTGIVDQLQHNGWSYSSAFSSGNKGIGEFDAPIESYVGNTATLTFGTQATPAGRGAVGGARFIAAFSYTITQIAHGQARVDTTLVFTAHSGNSTTQNFKIFNVVNLDIDASATNDTATYDAGQQAFKYTDAGNNFGWHAGYNATLREASNFSSAGTNRLPTKTYTTGFDLSNNNTNTGTGGTNDPATGFQWNVTLAPGQSTTIRASFAIGTLPVPAPSAVALMGLGGLIAGRRRR